MLGRRRGIEIIAWLVAGAALLSSCARHVDPWQAVVIPTDADFGGLFFTDSLNGWISGGSYMIEGGIVGRTRDGGRSWSFRTGLVPGAPAGFALGAIQFRDTLNGCAVGAGGAILLTADGGATWREAREGRTPGDGLARLQFLDSRRGWAVGSASLLHSEDGGESWRPLVAGNDENGYFSGNAICFVDADRGWLAAHGGTVMRSGDGGLHWSAVPMPLRADQHPALWDVTFADPQRGWIVGDQGTIFHTSDAGVTWKRQAKGVPIARRTPPGEPRPHDVVPELELSPDRLTLSAVHFIDAQRGQAVGYYSDVGESVVIGTHDGGATWELERTQPGTRLRALFVLDRSHAWAVGDRSRRLPQVVLRYRPVAG